MQVALRRGWPQTKAGYVRRRLNRTMPLQRCGRDATTTIVKKSYMRQAVERTQRASSIHTHT